jgi:hypothetical protein
MGGQLAHPGVAEGPLEVRVQGRQVEEGLVDVEHLDAVHHLVGLLGVDVALWYARPPPAQKGMSMNGEL